MQLPIKCQKSQSIKIDNRSINILYGPLKIMSSNKQQLGQFMTTNYEYILKNMNIPNDVLTIIEPFCGKCDLLKFVDEERGITLECYDIDPQTDIAIQRDTLLDPPSYEGKFVLTNPPYLARNKATNKEAFDMYNTNDLYKCFILSMLINPPPSGGIMIIPLNFLSSIRKSDINLRSRFLQVFDIIQINIFEEQVFEDTTYTTCSIQFETKCNTPKIKIDIYPSEIHVETALSADNNYMIGGHIYNLPESKTYTITRLTRMNEDQPYTNILVKCIDDNEANQIGLSMVEDNKIYIDKTTNLSSRTYATLLIEPPISADKQHRLVERFQKFLSTERKKFNSLFLCNYRESKDIARKRISFGLVYSICGYILDQIDREFQ